MTDFIILAAGKGTRLKSETSKALIKVLGIPMIHYTVDLAKSTGICGNIIIVTSSVNGKDIKKELSGEKCNFVIQKDQLGTGDAVKSVIDSKIDLNNNVLVLLVDHPLIPLNAIIELNNEHTMSGSSLSMVTACVPNYDGVYAGFYHDGRIKRDMDGNILGIIEPTEATEDDMKIKEINTSLYIFNRDWLIENISKIKINGKKNEYYLTDLVKMAVDQGIKIGSVKIDAKDSAGINTQKDLETVESFLKEKK